MAEAETPDWPWTIHHEPVQRIPGVKFPAEDPFLWWHEGSWWMVAKDMTGAFTGTDTSLGPFASDNGVSWRPAARRLASRSDQGAAGDNSVDGQHYEALFLSRYTAARTSATGLNHLALIG